MLKEQGNSITEEWKLYMYLLRCAIRGNEPDESVVKGFSGISSQMLWDMARNNNQVMLMEDYIRKYSKYINEEKFEHNKPLEFVIICYEIYKCIRRVVEAAKERGLTFVLFKGCILSNLYPNYIERSSCDTDIFVYREEKEQALNLLHELGYTELAEKSNPEVTALKYERGRVSHVIELHTCLWEDYEGRRMDILESMEITKRETLINLKVCGFEVTTLGYEQHLIFQLFHIIKHFSLEGVGLKYLADIALYVDAYGKYIDKDSLWKKLDMLGFSKFSYYIFVICAEFLGMDTEILNGQKIEMGPEVVDFMQDLLQAGKIYGDKSAGWQILGMMTPYFTGNRGTSQSKWKRKLEVVFPRAKDLPDEFAYAKKMKFLLPVAWVHKAVNYLIRWSKYKDIMYNTSEKLEVAEHRIALMKGLGLLEK